MVGTTTCNDARTVAATFVSALLGAGMVVQRKDIVITERSANIPVQLKGSDGKGRKCAQMCSVFAVPCWAVPQGV